MKKYKDFKPHDLDLLEFIETKEFKHIRHICGQGKCIFQLNRHTNKNEYINWALQSNLGMVIGKFLIPEVAKEMNLEISDLYQLSPLIAKLDDKHKYEEIIYNSYLENKDFILTEEQRLKAYQSYKESRGLK